MSAGSRLENEKVYEYPQVGSEAPRSMTLSVYYKGYSIMLTQRDPDTKLKPLLDNAIDIIKSLEADLDFQPSWNKQTNQELKKLNPSTAWMNEGTTTNTSHPELEDNLGRCKKCGAPNKISKQGKIFCSAICWTK